MVLLAALLLAACTSTRHFSADGYTLPADKPVTILVMRPDVEVGSATAGGLVEPNADWTAQARRNLAAALAAHARGRGVAVASLPDRTGEGERIVADYEALHRAVVSSIAAYKYGQTPLPTKKGKRFDWTLGPGAARLRGTDSAGSNYALFLVTRDAFATSGRVAMQMIGLLLGGYMPAGQHIAYASLVDLETGDIVWFNLLDGSAGDIRTPEGAKGLVDRLMRSMPSRPGEGPRK